MGLTTSVSGTTVLGSEMTMLITPSGLSRYKMQTNHLVKVYLKTGKPSSNIRPSIEFNLHRNIYNKHHDINAIIHTLSIAEIFGGATDYLS
jgi:ribulose-5-phosphate 4-epimerase/fuculose-1-phosphate aldolase